MTSSMRRVIPSHRPPVSPITLTDASPLRHSLRGLAIALTGPATAPSHDFQQSLRRRLVTEAAELAAIPPQRTPHPPRSDRYQRPKGGGIRLAAFGVGLSLAGSGIVAAAYSFAPAKLATASPVQTLAHHPGPDQAAGSEASSPSAAGAAASTAALRRGSASAGAHPSDPLIVASVAPSARAEPGIGLPAGDPYPVPTVNGPATQGLLAATSVTPSGASPTTWVGIGGHWQGLPYPLLTPPPALTAGYQAPSPVPSGLSPTPSSPLPSQTPPPQLP